MRAAPLAALPAVLITLLMVAPLPVGSLAPSSDVMAAAAVAAGPLDVPLERLEQGLQPFERYEPRPPGTVSRMTLTYGPFPMPAGWDLNRVHLDLPLSPGFVTTLAWRLTDAVTGEEPTNMEVHIHHGLWFRGGGHNTGDFLFGTGEERTQVDLDARSALQDDGVHYGVPFTANENQAIVMMLHNKEFKERLVVIHVDVTFVSGTAQAIAAAQDCGAALGLFAADGCLAGATFHGVTGYLWGDLFSVPREATGDDVYNYPVDGAPSEAPTPPTAPVPLPVPSQLPDQVPGTFFLNTTMVVPADATLVQAVGHVHQGGRATLVVNLGSAAQPCGDLDGDGLPGITLMRSAKMDREPGAHPASEDFQMGITKPGFRAPLRAGDRLAQFGLYANRDYATYQAMTFAAAHVDPAERPRARVGGCSLENTAPRLLDDPIGDPTETVPNRAWTGDALPLCGGDLGPACDVPQGPLFGGYHIARVVIGGFAYVPGDQHISGAAGAPPKVPQGKSLIFANADMANVIRHTVTSCAWPCNGPYRANYPLPDGRFDSGRMGNIDGTDGGSIPPEPADDAIWGTPTNLPPGKYSYYCRLHPVMRGAFQVLAD